MPRFSLNDLLFATALIALGTVMVTTLLEYPPRPGKDAFPVIVLWFGGGAMIGEGLFTPFGKVRWGALAGVAIQLIVGIVLAIVRLN
jgi:hypothetical protein